MGRLKMNLCSCEGYDLDAVDGEIFPFTPEEAEKLEVGELEDQAFDSLWNAALRHHERGEKGFCDPAIKPGSPGRVFAYDVAIDVYTCPCPLKAVIAFLEICHQERISITFLHPEWDVEGELSLVSQQAFW